MQKKKKTSTKLQLQVSPTVCTSERVNKREATCESLRPDQKPAEHKLLRRHRRSNLCQSNQRLQEKSCVKQDSSTWLHHSAVTHAADKHAADKQARSQDQTRGGALKKPCI